MNRINQRIQYKFMFKFCDCNVTLWVGQCTQRALYKNIQIRLKAYLFGYFNMQLFLDNKTDTHNQTLIIQWIYSNNKNNRHQEKYKVCHGLEQWAVLWNSSIKFEIDQTQDVHIRTVKYFHDSCNDYVINSILHRFFFITKN